MTDALEGLIAGLRSLVRRGGPGSGHFGHEGRPGEVGGSTPGEGGGQAEATQQGAHQKIVFEVGTEDDTATAFTAAVDRGTQGFRDAIGYTPDVTFTNDAMGALIQAQGTRPVSTNTMRGWANDMEFRSLGFFHDEARIVWLQDSYGLMHEGAPRWTQFFNHEMGHVAAADFFETRHMRLGVDVAVPVRRESYYKRYGYEPADYHDEYVADLLGAHISVVSGEQPDYAFKTTRTQEGNPFTRNDYRNLNILLDDLQQPQVATRAGPPVPPERGEWVLVIFEETGEAMLKRRELYPDADDAGIVTRGGDPEAEPTAFVVPSTPLGRTDRRIGNLHAHVRERVREIVGDKPVERGGPGSGHFGHQGRPGDVGGSSPGEAVETLPQPFQGRRYPEGFLADLPSALSRSEGGPISLDKIVGAPPRPYWLLPSGDLLSVGEQGFEHNESAMAAVRAAMEGPDVSEADKAIAQTAFKAFGGAEEAGFDAIMQSGVHRLNIDGREGMPYVAYQGDTRATYGQRQTAQGIASIIALPFNDWGFDVWVGHATNEEAQRKIGMIERGGPGSGHFGHEGRPGERGGSLPEGTPERDPRGRGGVLPHDVIYPPAFLKALPDAIKETYYSEVVQPAEVVGHIRSFFLTPDGTLVRMRGEHREAAEKAALAVMDSGILTPEEKTRAERLVGMDAVMASGVHRLTVNDLRQSKDRFVAYQAGTRVTQAQWDTAMEIASRTAMPFDEWRIDTYNEDQSRETAQRKIGLTERGGPGSGHFGHEGRPGEVGGSAPGGGERPKEGRDVAVGGTPYSKLAETNDLEFKGIEEGTFSDFAGAVEGKAGKTFKGQARWIAGMISRKAQREGIISVARDDEERSQEVAGQIADRHQEDWATEAVTNLQTAADQFTRNGHMTSDELRQALDFEEQEWAQLGRADIEDALFGRVGSEEFGEEWNDNWSVRNEAELIEAINEIADSRRGNGTFDPDADEIREELGDRQGSQGSPPEGEHYIFGYDDDGDMAGAMNLTEAPQDSEEWDNEVETRLGGFSTEAMANDYLVLHLLSATSGGEASGTKMMRQALRMAAERDMGLIASSVNEATGFYERIGATFTGRETSHEGQDIFWSPPAVKEALAMLEAGEMPDRPLSGESTTPEADLEEESLAERGGPGSGHFGHEGRPGEVGGSAAGEGDASVNYIAVSSSLFGHKPTQEDIAGVESGLNRNSSKVTAQEARDEHIEVWVSPEGNQYNVSQLGQRGLGHEESAQKAILGHYTSLLADQAVLGESLATKESGGLTWVTLKDSNANLGTIEQVPDGYEWQAEGWLGEWAAYLDGGAIGSSVQESKEAALGVAAHDAAAFIVNDSVRTHISEYENLLAAHGFMRISAGGAGGKDIGLLWDEDTGLTDRQRSIAGTRAKDTIEANGVVLWETVNSPTTHNAYASTASGEEWRSFTSALHGVFPERALPWPERLVRLASLLRIRGGPGSGHFGHAGRPGEVGGSAPEGVLPDRESLRRKYGDEIVAVAQEHRERAALLEPNTTVLVSTMAELMGGNMEGMEFRLKTEESLARKIDSVMHEMGMSAEEAADQFSDTVRYTMVFEKDAFVDDVIAVQEQLSAEGWTQWDTAWKNYFAPGDDYDGYNTALVNEQTGQRFELQFHTPETWQIKHESWAVYNRWRNTHEDGPIRQQLMVEMQQLWAQDYGRPDGWERLPGVIMQRQQEVAA